MIRRRLVAAATGAVIAGALGSCTGSPPPAAAPATASTAVKATTAPTASTAKTNPAGSRPAPPPPSPSPVATAARTRFLLWLGVAGAGLRTPYAATYSTTVRTTVDGKRGPIETYRFQFWYEPGGQAPGPFVPFVYERSEGSDTLRFLAVPATGGAVRDYECVEASDAWRCAGPFGPESIGQTMRVAQFEWPVATFLGVIAVPPVVATTPGPYRFFGTEVAGERVSCVGVSSQAASYCLTPAGHLAEMTSTSITTVMIEHHAIEPIAEAFRLPAAPDHVDPWMTAWCQLPICRPVF